MDDANGCEQQWAWKQCIDRAFQTGQFENAGLDSRTVDVIRELRAGGDRHTSAQLDERIESVMFGQSAPADRYAVMLALSEPVVGLLCSAHLELDAGEAVSSGFPKLPWSLLSATASVNHVHSHDVCGESEAPEWKRQIDDALKCGDVALLGLGDKATFVVTSLLRGSSRRHDHELDLAIDSIMFDPGSTVEQRYAVVSAIVQSRMRSLGGRNDAEQSSGRGK